MKFTPQNADMPRVIAYCNANARPYINTLALGTIEEKAGNAPANVDPLTWQSISVLSDEQEKWPSTTRTYRILSTEIISLLKN